MRAEIAQYKRDGKSKYDEKISRPERESNPRSLAFGRLFRYISTSLLFYEIADRLKRRGILPIKVTSAKPSAHLNRSFYTLFVDRNIDKNSIKKHT